MLYWTTRVLLVVAWLVVAWLAGGRGGRRGRTWRTGVVAALVFASLRALPWNYALLEVARGLLREAGCYDDRWLGKLGVGVLFVAVVALGVVTSRWRQLAPAVAVAHLGVALQAVLLAIETASLDEVLPGMLFTQPWRYALEGTFVGLALAGLACVRTSRELVAP